MISPNLQEYFVDKTTGLPLSGGSVVYYVDNARSDLKPVYQLSGQPGSYDFTVLPNPLTLSGVGTTLNGSGADTRVYYYPYDADGNLELYYIEVFDSQGNPQLQRQAWPNLSSSSGNTNYVYNFIRNSSWYSWNNGTDFKNVGEGSTSFTDFIIPDWAYQQNDSTQTIEISQGKFAAGQSVIPGNPPFYLIYNNTSSGSGLGTQNYFLQTYNSVQTLSGSTVSASVWINSNFAGLFSMTLSQYFGTGGTPHSTVITSVITVPVMTVGAWTLYTGTVALPSINTFNIGTMGDDQLLLALNMPLNQTCTINIGPMRLEQSSAVSVGVEMSNDDLQKETNYTGLYPAWTTGDVKFTINDTAGPGWLMMDNGTVGKVGSNATHTGLSYYALFTMLWNNIGSNAYTPIFTSAGILSTFGATADQDWNAGKQIQLTLTLGRALAGANPTGSADFQSYISPQSSQVNVGSNYIQLIDSSQIYVGTAVQFTSTGTLPGGISASTTYYCLPSPGLSANSIQLCTTLAQAISGTANVTITSVGTGTAQLTMGVFDQVHNLGSMLGEDAHALIPAELAGHLHANTAVSTVHLAGSDTAIVQNNPGTAGPVFASPTGGGIDLNNTITVTTAITAVANTPANTKHNNIQPTTYLNCMIKL